MSTLTKVNELGERRSRNKNGRRRNRNQETSQWWQIISQRTHWKISWWKQFVEIGTFITHRSTAFNMAEKDTPADGVITGVWHSWRSFGVCI